MSGSIPGSVPALLNIGLLVVAFFCFLKALLNCVFGFSDVLGKNLVAATPGFLVILLVDFFIDRNFPLVGLARGFVELPTDRKRMFRLVVPRMGFTVIEDVCRPNTVFLNRGLAGLIDKVCSVVDIISLTELNLGIILQGLARRSSNFILYGTIFEYEELCVVIESTGAAFKIGTF